MPAISKQNPEQAREDPEEALRSARLASSDDDLGADAHVEKLWLSKQALASDVASTDCDRHEFFSMASNYMPSECWTPTPWSSTGNSRAATPAPRRPSSSATSIAKTRGRAESALSGLQVRKAETTTSHSLQARGPHSARTDRTSLWTSTIQSEIDRGTMMRVIVRLPGERRTHILVRPTTRVGPEKPKTDCFSAYWGQDAEAMGPFSGRKAEGSSEPSNRRLTRVRRVFTERAAAGSQHASPSTAGQGMLDLDSKSLKELVQVATGIPANQQKLTFGMRGPLDCDESLLKDCGLRDGSEIRLMLKPKAPKRLLQDSQAHPDESWQVEPARADWCLQKPYLRTDTLEFTKATPRFSPRLIVNSWNSTDPKSSKPLLWRSMKSPVLCP